MRASAARRSSSVTERRSVVVIRVIFAQPRAFASSRCTKYAAQLVGLLRSGVDRSVQPYQKLRVALPRPPLERLAREDDAPGERLRKEEPVPRSEKARARRRRSDRKDEGTRGLGQESDAGLAFSRWPPGTVGRERRPRRAGLEQLQHLHRRLPARA